ncbi:MAG: DUF1722 domain-containing protein [Gammaproteobacteria bacterium]|nr:MAG: DUF1722 domain-containing protein [Gammaproteobacteria bacterium]
MYKLQTKRPRIGVSACLLGRKVRFDGGHKHNRYISSLLSEHVGLLPVCPEMELGLGVPRPTIQLRSQGQDPRLVVSKDPGLDLTDSMKSYASGRVETLGELDGFIFKKDSPSCGLFRVPVVINEQGHRMKEGTGLFAQTFVERYPLIPVEEEGRLNDAVLRENFFERVYAYRRWKEIPEPESNVFGFIEFHARHKLMLMSRGSSYYQELGRVVAGVTRKDLSQRRDAYIHRFMEIMSMNTRRGRQVNVMQHILGYLKQVLSADDKSELLNIFEAYRQQQLPLITPITLLRHHLRRHPQPYLDSQHYLQPYPEQLALRSTL